MKDCKSVATWISFKDYAVLQHLAFTNNVTVASYLRGIIVDALFEESFPNKQKVNVVQENHTTV